MFQKSYLNKQYFMCLSKSASPDTLENRIHSADVTHSANLCNEKTKQKVLTRKDVASCSCFV